MASTQVEVKKAVPSRNGSVEPWRSFHDEMDRLFGRFSRGFGFPSLEPLWTQAADVSGPATDIAEDEKAYTITAELPGMEPKDIEVTVSGGVLTIKGEKKQEKEEKDKNYYLSERSYGLAQRAFVLPEGIDQEKMTAGFAQGVLTVTLPKSAEAQKSQKKIEVKAA